MEFPVIALAKEQKVPKYKLESLKKKFPRATFVNLNLEVDYDNGKAFNNRQIVLSATNTVLRRSTPFYRKVARLMMRHRPAYCLSFWEPGVAMFINAMNCPTKLVTVCSQGQTRCASGKWSQHVAACVEIDHWLGTSRPNFEMLELGQFEVDSADF